MNILRVRIDTGYFPAQIQPAKIDGGLMGQKFSEHDDGTFISNGCATVHS